jgi:hypothetical protein
MLNEVKHLILVQPAESFKGIRFFASLRMTTLCLLAAGKAYFGFACFDFAQDKQDKQASPYLRVRSTSSGLVLLKAGARAGINSTPLPNWLGLACGRRVGVRGGLVRRRRGRGG